MGRISASSTPSKIWLTDIFTAEGWLYLAGHLEQYKQVLFLQAEVDVRLGKFDSAYKRYVELKLAIREKADPLL